jgi:glycolate oxidase FAD binding subunit
VVSTVRIRGIVEYEPGDLTITCGAGMTGGGLSERVGRHRQWLPLDPAGWRAGTIGATLANASTGSLRAGYGAPRDQVLGLTMVTGDGRVLELGGRVVKNVAGFDLVRLAVGSAGTLGVVTSATLRLHPMPELDRTLLVRGLERGELVQMARALAVAPVPIAALELGGLTLAVGGEVPQGPFLMARLCGASETVEAVEELLRPIIQAGDTVRLEEEEADELRSLIEAQEAESDVVVRLTLLPSRLGTLLEVADGLEEELSPADRGTADGKAAGWLAHVSWGIVRLLLPYTKGMGGLGARLIEARSWLEREGGSLRLVQGSMDLAEEVGPRELPEAAREISEGLKREFDPAGILPHGGPAL